MQNILSFQTLLRALRNFNRLPWCFMSLSLNDFGFIMLESQSNEALHLKTFSASIVIEITLSNPCQDAHKMLLCRSCLSYKCEGTTPKQKVEVWSKLPNEILTRIILCDITSSPVSRFFPVPVFICAWITSSDVPLCGTLFQVSYILHTKTKPCRQQTCNTNNILEIDSLPFLLAHEPRVWVIFGVEYNHGIAMHYTMYCFVSLSVRVLFCITLHILYIPTHNMTRHHYNVHCLLALRILLRITLQDENMHRILTNKPMMVKFTEKNIIKS